MWTYTPADLATNKKDAVRLTIGDTNTQDQQLQDEEISFFLTLRNSLWGAAAEACRAIAANLARQADSVQADMRVAYSSRSRSYAAMAARFENFAIARSGALPYAGGISIADKQRAEQDTDRVPPSFQIGMDDNALPIPDAGNEPQSFAPPSGVSS